MSTVNHETVGEATDNSVPMTFPLSPPPLQFLSPPSSTPGMIKNTIDPSTGNYHPDFMFCGTCTTCQDPPGNNEFNEEEKLETYENHDFSHETDLSVLSTKLHLRQPVQSASHVLVLESLLGQLPGVSHVTIDRQEQNIVVDHDASIDVRTILNTLESVGSSAVVRSESNIRTSETFIDDTGGESSSMYMEEPLWVRSQFYVRGICCASEVPVVRRIVKPLTGVSKMQINITTKIVHVHHDASRLSATQIAQTLSKEGFPSKIEKDGKIAAVTKKHGSRYGRTTLAIEGGLTSDKLSRIENQMSHLPAVSRIGFDIDASLVFIDHDTATMTSQDCMEALHPTFVCRIHTAAESSMRDGITDILFNVKKSKYVESTISIPCLGVEESNAVRTIVLKNYKHSDIRAIYPNRFAETMKVEHNPQNADIFDICRVINDSGHYKACVMTNGAENGLYLPERNSTSESLEVDEPSLFANHVNVWLSGVCWALSMASYVEELNWFKWFGLGSVVFGLPPICAKAYRTLRRRQFDANCMMVTAAFGAVALGEYDEAASVAFLFAVSEFLEARATVKARRALSAIVKLRPDHANVVHPISKEIVIVPADQVPLGSLISIKTGDKIAADGIIVEGSTSIDESSLTGEARPAHKKAGDTVRGGTINIGTSPLTVRTTTTVDDSAVSRLIRLVEEAQSNRSPTEMMIDTFARSYTPTVVFAAIIMCTIPWLWGHETGRYWTLNGLIIIVIACPCALTISTPVTYAAGLAATAQRGIIVKGGAKLEAMGSVDRIVFDKTGTLTRGSFSVRHLEVVGTSKTRQQMLQLMALMQERSSHPLSASLVQAAKKEGIDIPRNVIISDHTILKGEGISAKANGLSIYVGNQRLFARLNMMNNLSESNRALVAEWAHTGGTIGFIGTHADGIVGMFCVVDTIREDASAVIRKLKAARIDTMICTGDSDSAAQAVAKQIGIPSRAVKSQLLPEDKLHFVGSLKRPQPKRFVLCQRKRYILFCGDGVNDAPALAVADIGASMGEGAAMAMEMSDITLMDSQLTKLVYTIDMGRKVLRTVKENICISLVAKGAVVVATFFGKMTLLFAIASDVGIMLLVTLNGMKLLPNSIYAPEEGFEIPKLSNRKKTRSMDGNEFELASMVDTENESDDSKYTQVV